MLCNTHHITTHDDCKLFMRALIIDIKLNIRKVYNVQTDRTTVACNQFCKVYNFLFCTFACVRRGMEIHCLDLDSTFCDHITCYWTVNTTRKEKHGFSVCSDRHPSRSRNSLGIYINLVTDLYGKCHFRIVYINRCLWERIEDFFTYCCTDFHRGNRVRFFCSSCVYLEGTFVFRISCFHVGNDILCHLIKALIFINDNRADTNDTKHSL